MTPPKGDFPPNVYNSNNIRMGGPYVGGIPVYEFINK